MTLYNISALPFDDLSAVTQKPGSVPLAPVEPRPTVVCKPKTVISSRLQRKIPLLSKSLFENKQNLLMDLGLMHAKRFRIGWGPLSERGSWRSTTCRWKR